MKATTIIKLKLQVDDDADLLDRSAVCRRARNAAVEDWLLRQRGKGESHQQNGKHESTKLYHAIRTASPDIGTQVAAAIAGGVNSFLAAKLDWRREADSNGNRRRRRDAILSYEDRIPFFTDFSIPAHNSYTRIVGTEQGYDVIFRGWWSGKQSAREFRASISMSRLSAGLKRLLGEVATGQRKLQCATVLHRKSSWFFHLPIQFENVLHGDKEAHLWPVTKKNGNGQSDRPYKLVMPNRVWYIGDGRFFVSQMNRLIGLRKQIGWRYRQRMGAGHGRTRVDEAKAKRQRQMRNYRDEVRRRAIADVVRWCCREECGSLVYHEPTNPAKDLCWWALNGADWDWTRFAADLQNACARQGIEVTTMKLKRADVTGCEDQ